MKISSEILDFGHICSLMMMISTIFESFVDIFRQSWKNISILVSWILRNIYKIEEHLWRIHAVFCLHFDYINYWEISSIKLISLILLIFSCSSDSIIKFLLFSSTLTLFLMGFLTNRTLWGADLPPPLVI